MAGGTNFAISLGNGDDVFTAGYHDFGMGPQLFDNIGGSGGHDTLTAYRGNTSLYGNDGNDTLTGLQGSDILDGGADADIINAGAGGDIIYGGTGNDDIDAGAGSDTIWLRDDYGNDTVEGGIGYDTVILDGTPAGGPDLFLTGSFTGVERLFLQRDGLRFNAGALDGFRKIESDGTNFFNCTITQMTAGASTLRLSGDNFDVFGSGGDDQLTISIDGTLGEHQLFIDAGAGHDTVTLLGSALNAHGGTGNDVLNGNRFGNTLYGEIGIDTLRGNAGNDTLYGGADADRITGGDGRDTLFGGGADGARDLFIFAAGWDVDTVKDFQDGQDRLDLRALNLANGIDDLIIRNSSVGTIISLDLNGDNIPDSTDRIILEGVNSASIGTGDFLF